jgi:hypothetical protein
MDIQLCRTHVRSLAAAACVLLGTAWAGGASAQSQPIWNEKVAQVNEPYEVRSTLRLGAAVGAGGNFILSQGGTSVYAFAKNTQGEWTQTAKLVAPDKGVLTGPIAFDGTHALIRGYNPQKTSVVYYYFYDGARWRPQAILKGTANFGRTIALDGCTALITSGYEELGRFDWPWRDRFVHHLDRCRSGTGSWTWVGSIPGSNVGAGLRFGASVALSGNNAIIGSADKVYHYVRSGDAWNLVQTIEAPGTEYVRNFGYSLAFRDNLLLVAASYTFTDRPVEGIVYRYSWNGSQWVSQGSLYPPNLFDGPGMEDFGRKIIITTDRVFLSAPALRGAVTRAPAVYALFRSGPDDVRPATWVYLQDIDYSVPYDEIAGYTRYGESHYGSDIAVSGNTIVVGAKAFNPPEKQALVEGRTTVYTIPPVNP